MKHIPLFRLVLAFACNSGQVSEKQDSSSVGKPSAEPSAANAACAVLSFKVLKDTILGRNIGELPGFKCYLSKDTVLEGDEGVTWKGKAFYTEGQLVFVAETNWENQQKIHRITVVSPVIREGQLFVGHEL